ncbi:hypothetical protein EPO14_01055 [Patescibacteria group bacterium]|nr:MAG: hypothetical protein EPO14_01055 [Patescibacteria group bacterium]
MGEKVYRATNPEHRKIAISLGFDPERLTATQARSIKAEQERRRSTVKMDPIDEMIRRGFPGRSTAEINAGFQGWLRGRGLKG